MVEVFCQGEKARVLSVVIPTFEEDELNSCLDELVAYLVSLPEEHLEILLVDDSGERWKRSILDYAEKNQNKHGDRLVIRLIHGRRRGKGDAIRLGALAARGEIVFTMDADLPVPLKHIEEFVAIIDEQGADAVIGERPLTRNLREPLRYLLSRILYVVQMAWVFGSNRYYDTQCGFKAFRGNLIRELAARQMVSGGMYDIEYLYMAMLWKASVARVPVVPNAERRASKIRVVMASITDPVDLLRVKLGGLLGRYDASGPSAQPFVGLR